MCSIALFEYVLKREYVITDKLLILACVAKNYFGHRRYHANATFLWPVSKYSAFTRSVYFQASIVSAVVYIVCIRSFCSFSFFVF